MVTRLTGKVDKGWGHELIWHTSDKYCGKIMSFNKDARFSMHFHSEKDEAWYVLSGKFEVKYIETTNATQKSSILNVGDTWHNPPLLPHQLICIEEGSILEVSTPDSAEDNYRIIPGDNQK